MLLNVESWTTGPLITPILRAPLSHPVDPAQLQLQAPPAHHRHAAAGAGPRGAAGVADSVRCRHSTRQGRAPGRAIQAHAHCARHVATPSPCVTVMFHVTSCLQNDLMELWSLMHFLMPQARQLGGSWAAVGQHMSSCVHAEGRACLAALCWGWGGLACCRPARCDATVGSQCATLAPPLHRAPTALRCLPATPSSRTGSATH